MTPQKSGRLQTEITSSTFKKKKNQCQVCCEEPESWVKDRHIIQSLPQQNNKSLISRKTGKSKKSGNWHDFKAGWCGAERGGGEQLSMETPIPPCLNKNKTKNLKQTSLYYKLLGSWIFAASRHRHERHAQKRSAEQKAPFLRPRRWIFCIFYKSKSGATKVQPVRSSVCSNASIISATVNCTCPSLGK